MRDQDIHLWEVNASTPRVEGGSIPSYANLRFAVIARTMRRVMELSADRYGERIAFHSIIKRNYMGESKVLIDPDCAATVIRENYGSTT
jgi:hypothetical protein